MNEFERKRPIMYALKVALKIQDTTFLLDKYVTLCCSLKFAAAAR